MTYSTRIVGALALLLLAGCSSSPEKEQAASLKPLSVKEETSSILKGDDGYVVNWAGVLVNSNPWHFGEHVVATVIAKDAKGKEVVRLEQPLDAVPPAGSLSFTGQVVAVEKPSQVSIQYRPAQWRQAARIVSAFRPFPVSDVLTERRDDGYLITGYVGTPYRLPASSLAVTALLRDKNGKLLGGGSTFVDDVRANGKRRFILNIESVRDTSKIAKAELVARTWGSSSRPYEELALGGIAPPHRAKPTTAPFARDRGRQVAPAGDVRP
ncbi:hypothetical protein [Streptosporangium roseum]|uniref:Lipoprotein n=1 Tax=Streptosporangium roseum (strain ATCC 12428 / DSM 43021 / JCM 3005 / KCTC 9067 / NCIMB 10171 / NRRL 2505 / NI 9100) TaxID=479432 RepID=D2BB39_STRRD|nr:hypothetical protein [Streptosporangium roseum]ACZ91803.1 hypothetical protein Sros_9184 [Streptosporangium roseum DSM 43021]